jgi:hypothetical protein
MEAFLLSRIEITMHKETNNLRKILITHKKLFIEGVKNSLGENDFLILI